ncbi:MAG: hypothetical protein QOG71_2893 [Pyrinomonadaceae bacterium]|nr:hypothetical protein [Pyrinomonadaceae bacterium]
MNRTQNPLRGYSPFATGDARSTTAGDVRQSTDAPTPARLSRLSHALIAKSLAEALFVVALAVYFSYTNFNPYFRGSVDAADARAVAGWVVNEAAPGERVEVHLYVDGHFVSRRSADAPRPDVLEAGRSLDANHGFVFQLPPLPPNRTYEARVYALHATAGDATRRALQEFGAAKQFSVTADEVNSSVPDVWWESEGRR